MQITVEFNQTIYDQEMKKILQKHANATGKTINTLVEEWLKSWAEGQARAYYMNIFKEKTLTDLYTMFGGIE